MCEQNGVELLASTLCLNADLRRITDDDLSDTPESGNRSRPAYIFPLVIILRWDREFTPVVAI